MLTDEIKWDTHYDTLYDQLLGLLDYDNNKHLARETCVHENRYVRCFFCMITLI